MWTKESIKQFVDRLLWWRQDYVDQELLENGEIMVDRSSFVDELPTQADKPSASSSLSKSQLKQKLLKSFSDVKKYTIFTVADTNSMEPHIDDNSLVVVETVTEDFKLRPGQVIIYDGTAIFGRFVLVIHRIWTVSNDGTEFYIKGDNNYFADGWVKREKIMYNVVAVGYYEQTEEGD